MEKIFHYDTDGSFIISKRTKEQVIQDVIDYAINNSLLEKDVKWIEWELDDIEHLYKSEIINKLKNIFNPQKKNIKIVPENTFYIRLVNDN